MTNPVLSQQTENGRMYVHPATGEAVYSVTTIIDAGIQKDLANWAAKQAAQYAVDNWTDLHSMSSEEVFHLISTAHERARDEASVKGDAVHTSAEGFTQGTNDGKSPKHMVQLKRFLDVSQFKMVHQEVTLWNRKEEYAGTADWIAQDRNGRFVLGDYKTGRGIWPEMAVQLEALAMCEFIITPDGQELEMPEIHTVGVLHLRPLSWWWHPIQDGYARFRNWKAFSAARKVHEDLEPIRNWKKLHPNMVWGNLGRFNEANWPVKAA